MDVGNSKENRKKLEPSSAVKEVGKGGIILYGSRVPILWNNTLDLRNFHYNTGTDRGKQYIRFEELSFSPRDLACDTGT